MTAVDWIIVGGGLFSVLLGLLRGIVRELIAVAGWVVAIVLALQYAGVVGAALPLPLTWPALQVGLGALLIVVATVLVASLAGWVAHKLLAAAKMSGADRALGAGFGLARAGLVLFVLVYFTHATAIAQQSWWQTSLLLPPLASSVRWLSPHLPDPSTALPAPPSSPMPMPPGGRS